MGAFQKEKELKTTITTKNSAKFLKNKKPMLELLLGRRESHMAGYKQS